LTSFPSPIVPSGSFHRRPATIMLAYWFDELCVYVIPMLPRPSTVIAGMNV
jgi:hypothetical protein